MMATTKEGVNISYASPTINGSGTYIPIMRNSNRVSMTMILPTNGLDDLLSIHVVNIMNGHLFLRTIALSYAFQLQKSRKEEIPRITLQNKRRTI